MQEDALHKLHDTENYCEILPNNKVPTSVHCQPTQSSKQLHSQHHQWTSC